MTEELRRLEVDERIGRLRAVLPRLDLRRRFELLDALGIYHHPETISGAGSTIEETAALRRILPSLVEDYEIRSILDVPCGDFNWFRRVPLSNVDYVGVDIVHRIIERNRRIHAGENRRFEVADATCDRLPKADLVVCRDLLIHLSLADISRVLRQVLRSGSNWFLATHFGDTNCNDDIESGDFRPVNLCAPPFELYRPVLVISEESRMAEGRFADRSMALWPITALEHAAGG